MTGVMMLTFDLGSNDLNPNPNLSFSMPFFLHRYKVNTSYLPLAAVTPPAPSQLGCTVQDQLSGVDSPPSLLPKRILTAPKGGTVTQTGKTLGKNNEITEWFGLKRTL